MTGRCIQSGSLFEYSDNLKGRIIDGKADYLDIKKK